jgi:3-hydroxyacyl-[acyl-carrier-protein] dehydratase
MSDTSNIIDIEEIKATIPHRFPILLVDRVVDITLEESIKAYKNITANEAVFSGHFPTKSIYPGVYILEGLAQVAIILAFKSLNLDNTNLVYFAGIDRVKFKKPVVPGDRLDYECKILKCRSKIIIVDAIASVNGEVVTTAELKAVLV